MLARLGGCAGRSLRRHPLQSRTAFRCATRNVWLTRTVVSDSHEELISALPPAEDARNSNVALFNLSRNIPSSSLSKLVEHFQNFPSKAIGCLSLGNEDGKGPYSLSYAIHKSPEDTLELVIPFRSTIAGVAKIALGREVRKMEKKAPDGEWAGEASVEAEDLPEELRHLDSSLVTQVIYFTDEQPQGLMKTIDAHIPKAEQLGLLASSTPFFTGRPHTLMYGKEIFSSGAVGVAICRYPARKEGSLKIDYNGLHALGEPLEVTVAKGNIILELASTNATKLLLERIQQDLGEVISKEQGFYMGILPEGQVAASLAEMVSVRPILAGDPSRGALSLDTEANVRPGQHVQFFHASSAFRNSDDTGMFSDGSIIFKCDASGISGKNSSSESSDYRAASEHGYVVGRAGEKSWICGVEGSSGGLRL